MESNGLVDWGKLSQSKAVMEASFFPFWGKMKRHIDQTVAPYQIMDPKRELELQFQIAAADGDVPELTRCMDAGVDLECVATESELDHYRKLRTTRHAPVA